MVKRIACGAVVFSLLMLWPAAPSVAEETEGKTIFMIEDLYVFPEKAEEFEALFKELKEVFIAHDFAYPVSFYRMDDLRYVAVWRFQGTAGVDKLNADWEALAKEWGEEVSAGWIDRFYATMSHWRSSLWRPRPDLSYKPENSADEFKYLVKGELWIKPGHQQAVEELVKESARVYAEHKVPHAWNAGEGSVGTECPTLGFAEWSASPGAFWMGNDAVRANEELSKKNAALWAQMAPHIRGYERETGWYLEHLSYRPKEKAEGAEEE